MEPSLPELLVYNTLTRQKGPFLPLVEGHVGMYVCGPTVYGDAHLGHARTYTVFDVLFRYLKFRGNRVRYVRNITDVGHLEHDADEGEDKIAKRARVEQLEPMEVAQLYTNAFHQDLGAMNILLPSIEPLASGHITEQIGMIQTILDQGLAYESNGSVYFDVAAYNKVKPYGILSGRNLDDTLSGTRELDGQSEKRNAADFALWKRADPWHIMRWPSPWSEGFPGWHLECSAMGSKYLGKTFDIHGGGMDLIFPHHEAEIAQSQACFHQDPVRYWMHVNMIQINGQKMSKSLGNFITLKQFYSGEHAMLDQPYPPMTIRMFILQAHYRSTLDFGTEGLKASGKAYRRLMNGLLALDRLPNPEGHNPDETSAQLEAEILADAAEVHTSLSDDLNTATAIAALFNLLKRIHGLAGKPEMLAQVSPKALQALRDTYRGVLVDVLGLRPEDDGSDALRNGLLDMYREAKAAKDWARVDQLRGAFKSAGLALQDGKTGSFWAYSED